MMRYSMIPLTLSLVLLVGCDLSGRDENPGPTCQDTVTELSLDEFSELGFSGQELLDLATANDPWSVELVYARDESVTPMTLSVDASAVTGARFVASEAVYPDSDEPSIAIGIECPDRVEVDVVMSVLSEDGAFDEQLSPLKLIAYDVGEAAFSAELDPEALGGSYEMDVDITETGWDDRKLWIQGDFDESGSRGQIEGQVSGEDDCEAGDACSAWAAMVAVGAWDSSLDSE